MTGGQFQFPSNGKADPKDQTKSEKERADASFQFPSNGKADPKGIWVRVYIQTKKGTGFNSLQTGKRIQSTVIVPPYFDVEAGFNSLQTGKRIQRADRYLIQQIG